MRSQAMTCRAPKFSAACGWVKDRQNSPHCVGVQPNQHSPQAADSTHAGRSSARLIIMFAGGFRDMQDRGRGDQDTAAVIPLFEANEVFVQRFQPPNDGRRHGNSQNHRYFLANKAFTDVSHQNSGYHPQVAQFS